MSSFIPFVIVAVIVIALVAYYSSGAGNKKRTPQAYRQSPQSYHHRCPYCGADFGNLPHDRTVCGSCRRTYVIGRAPSAEEKGAMQREESEIAFIGSPSFPLETVKQTVAAAFCDGKRYAAEPGEISTGADFKSDHLEILTFSTSSYTSGRRRVLDYPPLGTEAAMHVLTEACLRHLKDLYPSQCARRNVEPGEYNIVWNNP